MRAGTAGRSSGAPDGAGSLGGRTVRRWVALVAGTFALGCGSSGGDGGSSGASVVAQVRMDPASLTMDIGQITRFLSTPKDKDGNVVSNAPAASWQSSAPAVATVTEDGTVTAVAPGTAQIQATVGKVAGTATVTVQKPPVTALTVAPGTASLARGQTAQFTARTFLESGGEVTDRTIAWTSTNPAAATVAATGAAVTVTAVAPGTTTIRATSEGKTAEGTVIVIPDPIIALSPATVTFTATLLGANPANQVVSIVNTGGGTLSGLSLGTVTYGAGQPTGWLTATLGGTTAPSGITLGAAIGSLANGTYTASFPVRSSLAASTRRRSACRSPSRPPRPWW